MDREIMGNTEVIGRESLTEYMRAAAGTDKLSHAYIFEGEKGIGKLFLAKYFAKLILCTDKKNLEYGLKRVSACGVCISCKQTNSGNNPDIIYVEHENPKLISVDDIRKQVIADVGILPFSSKYKIYIIKDAEKMNEQAQNAILKTIEEPPEYVIIILLSANKGKLLQTVKSRCVLLDIKPVDKNVIKEYLIKKYASPDYAAEVAAEFSAGNIGRAVRYVTEGDFTEMKDEIVRLMRRLDNERLSSVIESVKSLEGYKNEIKDCIDLMKLWFRDMLVLKATGDANRLLFKNEYNVLKEQANIRSYLAVEEALEAMEKAKQRLDANVNFDTVMELMFMRMKEK